MNSWSYYCIIWFTACYDYQGLILETTKSLIFTIRACASIISLVFWQMKSYHSHISHWTSLLHVFGSFGHHCKHINRMYSKPFKTKYFCLEFYQDGTQNLLLLVARLTDIWNSNNSYKKYQILYFRIKKTIIILKHWQCALVKTLIGALGQNFVTKWELINCISCVLLPW